MVTDAIEFEDEEKGNYIMITTMPNDAFLSSSASSSATSSSFLNDMSTTSSSVMSISTSAPRIPATAADADSTTNSAIAHTLLSQTAATVSLSSNVSSSTNLQMQNVIFIENDEDSNLRIIKTEIGSPIFDNNIEGNTSQLMEILTPDANQNNTSTDSPMTSNTLTDPDDFFPMDKSDFIQSASQLTDFNTNDENFFNDLNFDDLLLPGSDAFLDLQFSCNASSTPIKMSTLNLLQQNSRLSDIHSPYDNNNSNAVCNANEQFFGYPQKFLNNDHQSTTAATLTMSSTPSQTICIPFDDHQQQQQMITKILSPVDQNNTITTSANSSCTNNSFLPTMNISNSSLPLSLSSGSFAASHSKLQDLLMRKTSISSSEAYNNYYSSNTTDSSGFDYHRTLKPDSNSNRPSSSDYSSNSGRKSANSNAGRSNSFTANNNVNLQNYKLINNNGEPINTNATTINTLMENNSNSHLLNLASSSAPTGYSALAKNEIGDRNADTTLVWQRREPRKHLLSTSSLIEANSTGNLTDCLSSTAELLLVSPECSFDESFNSDDDADDSDDHYDDYSTDSDYDEDEKSNINHSGGRIRRHSGASRLEGGGGGSSGSSGGSRSGSGSTNVGVLRSLSKSGSKKERFFWQYNVQSKGPKGQKLVLKTKEEDPHNLNEVTDPVFSTNCPLRGLKHNGKARKGDGNDLTPNPKKLSAIGREIDKLSNLINGITSAKDRPHTRKEKNKLASRACRLKKKAQHEANKIKLYGLDQEHRNLMQGISQIKHLLEDKFKFNNEEKQAELTSAIENNYRNAISLKVAGNTTEYVNVMLTNAKQSHQQ